MSFTITFDTDEKAFQTTVKGEVRTFKQWKISKDGSTFYVKFKDGTVSETSTSNVANFDGLTTRDEMLAVLDGLTATDALDLQSLRVIARLYKELSPLTPNATIQQNIRTWWNTEK